MLYDSGNYGGYFFTEKVMNKLVDLQEKYFESIKCLLLDELQQGNVFPRGWAMHYNKGEAEEYGYIDESICLEDLKVRINESTKVPKERKPRSCPLVFIADSRKTSKDMVDAYYVALQKGER